jgi:hypothetical protein
LAVRFGQSSVRMVSGLPDELDEREPRALPVVHAAAFAPFAMGCGNKTLENGLLVFTRLADRISHSDSEAVRTW